MAGEVVSYTLTLKNTSSADSPNLTCTITDSQLGIQKTASLAPGTQHVVSAAYTTQGSDPALQSNLASVRCQVDGFPNILEASSEFAVAISAPPPPASTPTLIPTSLPTTEPSPAGTDQQLSTQTPTPVPEVPAPDKTQEPVSSNLAGQGCSPGFWQGGYGRWLWNDANDPDWEGENTNPFTHETAFNSVFASHPGTDNVEMFSFVRRGGGPRPWRKVARDIVAAYLNASYGMNYPFSPQELVQMWADTVSGATSFAEVHSLLDEANNLGCPIGD
jgi:hypothetical protein